MSISENYSDASVTPPMSQAIPLGVQHVLAMFASNVTPAIIIAGAAGLAFGGTEQIYLIQATESLPRTSYPGQMTVFP